MCNFKDECRTGNNTYVGNNLKAKADPTHAIKLQYVSRW